MLFFASPAKAWLVHRANERRKAVPLKREVSQEGLAREPVMGLPNDPGEDLDEVLREVTGEVERTSGNGGRGTGSDMGQEVKDILRERTGKVG